MITREQVRHVGRLISQNIMPCEVGIIGGYHGVNLGDIALGTSVANQLHELGISSGLQTIYSLDRWPWKMTSKAIVGGGAVGYSDSLIKVAKRYRGQFENLAFLGVDYNDADYDGEILDMLRKCSWISCRNEHQAVKVAAVTGRSDISFHPDLAFSLFKENATKSRENRQQKEPTLLVNAVPMYARFENQKLAPSKAFQKERPFLFENFQTLQDSYIALVRNTVIEALDQGLKVETIPFTPADASYTSYALEGLPVIHNKYDSDPRKMFRKITKARRVFATRYHATIFALKAGAEIRAMTYALKNEKLLSELNVPRENSVSADDLARGDLRLPEFFTIDNTIMNNWEENSSAAIQKCIKTLT